MACRRGLNLFKLTQHRLRKTRTRHRCFCSSSGGSDSIVNVPLSKPVPWMPAPQYATLQEKEEDTQITTLENGMRVATQAKFGHFCTVGVLIDSGSRYEVSYPSGVTHFLEKLAFASNSQYPDRDAILQTLEKHGAICDCQGSRDTLIYAVSAETSGLSTMVQLLSEVVLKPCIKEQELEESKMAIQFELQNLDMQPDAEPLLQELIHSAAYRENTLGLPKTCPEESISLIDRGLLFTYMQNYHTPERMVLAGVGVDHDSFVDLAQSHFGNKKAVWQEDPSLITKKGGFDNSISQYTGGLITVEKDLSSVSLGPTPIPELAHVVLGFESCSHQDEDFIAFCVVNMLMGGGGSFSAGGPGKGMYTRLYLNVLNRHHWIYNATAFNHAYGDSGLFCIHGSAHPSKMRDLVDVITREVVGLQKGVHPVELSRAKTQLQSMLMMNLESRPVVFEDVGRQVLAIGHRLPPSHFFNQIGAISEEDVIRVAKRMLSSSPAVAAYGSLNNLPRYKDIEAALAGRTGQLPARMKLFYNR